jgi:hypothetical protein
MNAIAEQHGGKCLSLDYRNQRDQLLWECKFGHTWKARAGNIKSGTWCPVCGGRLKGSLEKMQKLAEVIGIKCLSKEYKNARSKLLWLCPNGHSWEATPDNIKQGKRCPSCAQDARRARPRKYTIEDCKSHAASFGGDCLTTDYSKTKFLWRCQKGHVWSAPPTSIFSSKSWCPECARKTIQIDTVRELVLSRGGILKSDSILNSKSKVFISCSQGHTWTTSVASLLFQKSWCPRCQRNALLSIEEMIRIAEERGGKCLSTTYSNARDSLLWQCANGHQWMAKPDSVKRGSWCKKCSSVKAGIAQRKYSINDLKDLAKKRGGDCLSSVAGSVEDKLEWKCIAGHRWRASPHSVILSGSWCPSCSKSLGERFCRIAFALLFSSDFPKQKPKWLISSTGQRLELDGYSDSLALAFEHQGEQHYSSNIHFVKSEEQMSLRLFLDCEKRRLCKENGVILIEIPEVPRLTRVEDLKQYILAECSANSVSVPNLDIEIDYSAAYIPDDRLSRLSEIAESRGGFLLSRSYLGMRFSYRWQCEKGHLWEQKGELIARGIWCPFCSGRRNNSIELLREMARRRNGVCLSTVYKNNKSLIHWKCNICNKEFFRSTKTVKDGLWCPHCRNISP